MRDILTFIFSQEALICHWLWIESIPAMVVCLCGHLSEDAYTVLTLMIWHKVHSYPVKVPLTPHRWDSAILQSPKTLLPLRGPAVQRHRILERAPGWKRVSYSPIYLCYVSVAVLGMVHSLRDKLLTSCSWVMGPESPGVCVAGPISYPPSMCLSQATTTWTSFCPAQLIGHYEVQMRKQESKCYVKCKVHTHLNG